MKNLLLLLLMTFTVSCCSVSYDTEKYYVNEKFILVGQNVEQMVIEGNTKSVRTWEIQRVVVENDSIMFGKIDDRGCGCGVITDEKWKEKMVGDTLYFEFINKVRFEPRKVAPIIVRESAVVPYDIPVSEPITNYGLETERKILEIERQILSLQRELETLKRVN